MVHFVCACVCFAVLRCYPCVCAYTSSCLFPPLQIAVTDDGVISTAAKPPCFVVLKCPLVSMSTASCTNHKLGTRMRTHSESRENLPCIFYCVSLHEMKKSNATSGHVSFSRGEVTESYVCAIRTGTGCPTCVSVPRPPAAPIMTDSIRSQLRQERDCWGWGQLDPHRRKDLVTLIFGANPPFCDRKIEPHRRVWSSMWTLKPQQESCVFTEISVPRHRSTLSVLKMWRRSYT